MKKWLLRSVIAATLLAVVGLTYLKSIGMFASRPVYASSGLAIQGYDTVAYFTQGKAVKGDERIAESWNGARWVFASEAHRSLFRENPAQYAPQFGGYCAFAVSQNYTAQTDPKAWTLADNKLYLNFDQDTMKEWLLQREQLIAQAHANWPDVLW